MRKLARVRLWYTWGGGITRAGRAGGGMTSAGFCGGVLPGRSRDPSSSSRAPFENHQKNEQRAPEERAEREREKVRMSCNESLDVIRTYSQRAPEERAEREREKVRMSCNESLDVIRTHSQRAPEERAERERQSEGGDKNDTHEKRHRMLWQNGRHLRKTRNCEDFGVLSETVRFWGRLEKCELFWANIEKCERLGQHRKVVEFLPAPAKARGFRYAHGAVGIGVRKPGSAPARSAHTSGEKTKWGVCREQVGKCGENTWGVCQAGTVPRVRAQISLQCGRSAHVALAHLRAPSRRRQ